MIKLSQYVAEFFVEAGLKHVFMLTGGGSMHLNDAFGRQKGLDVICHHHEQASAMAAESYARLNRLPAIVNVTTGPGGINTLNGVFGAWTDSIPMIVISGQVRHDTTIAGCGLPNIRQMGDQECDIIRMVTGITKYAISVTDPKTIGYHLQKALYLATHGRPGPVWIDIPMNVQGASIDVATLQCFDADTEIDAIPIIPAAIVTDILAQLKAAHRPVIMVGSGIRVSGAHTRFLQLLEHLQIPVATAWNAHDVLPDNHPLYVGRPGSIGNRSGNFAVQNADVLLILGSRLNIRQISYNWSSFARGARKIMIEIDPEELRKPTLSIDQAIHGDLRDFIDQAIHQLQGKPAILQPEWLVWCKARQAKYPVVLPEYWPAEGLVNPYCFMQALSKQLPEGQVIVSANGTACVTSFQAIELKPGQRLYTNSGSASMGYDIPAAMGACVASGLQKIVCLAGDGSAMQNIQELAAIAFKRYPIKIFLLNNQGYHSIRQTQQNFFGEPLVGVGEDSGLGFPNFEKLAVGFGLSYNRCDRHADLEVAIEQALTGDQPHICEIFLRLDQVFAPKLSSKRLSDGRMVTKPLEDMAPFLSEQEMLDNMLIPMMPEE